MRLGRRDGKVIPSVCRWAPEIDLQDTSKNPPHQAATQSEDVAVLKEQLALARAEAARYKNTFALSAVGMALVSLDGRFLQVNARLCEITGYAASELLARRFRDITYADDVMASERASQDLISGRLSNVRLEKRYVRPDGKSQWISLAVSLLRDSSGLPEQFMAIMEDISDRKEAEQTLKEREALLSSMGQFVPGIIHKVGYDQEGRAKFLYISDRAMEMFQLSPEVMASDYTAHHQRVHPDDLAYVRRLAKKPRLGTPLQPVDFEYRVILEGKGVRWYGGRALPQIELDGSLVWYGHTADITEHKLYQEARVAAQVADAANRAKSEFLSRMSHELRTPLNAVLGFAQLLRLDRQHPLTDGQRSKVELIERAGGHLLGVISDVLDLSRIDSGSLPLSIEPVVVAHVLDEAVSMVGAAALDAGVVLVPAQVARGINVFADRLRLRQILVNLLTNAIKYNRRGGRVLVSVWRDEGQDVCIEVSDTGRGLSAEQCAHLFEPFNRLGAETTGIEGTGIGLVIVRRLLELMHGAIDVSSEVGVGTRFVVRLPWAEMPEADWEQGEVSTISGTLNGPETGYTVLYVEDNDVNVALFRQVMSLRPQCRLLVAQSGRQALELAGQHRPDLLVLDMHLGDMTGFELAEALDRHPNTAGLPRVALSADAMPDTIHAAKARGFAAYLTKPLDVVAVLRCLDELMQV
ncbi:hybrid sensor histidine kinase/response regulator [Aquabacterium sp.]|uniref:hybrid sensor histidine kinase/response regulator n=1 Tax=Aquabacterium sp. TaxID=1872578 RepID=UPI002E37862B|nr:ATP-binding protein [Aquabacterium sp.]HEX5312850.1 ATP-binding protein [Aquabacterium sp.]